MCYPFLHGPPAMVKYYFYHRDLYADYPSDTPFDVHVVVVVEGQALVDVVSRASLFTREEGSGQLCITVL